jgi:glutaredoxin-like protein
MSALLDEEIRSQVREVFNQLQYPVQVLFFGKKTECEYCDDTRQLLEEVTSLSDKLGLSVYNVDGDGEIAARYNVERVPGIVIAGKDGDQAIDYGIRFSGIPSGHEFATLIHDLVLVSSRDSGLSPETRAWLGTLNQPIHLQVFVTPT